MVPMVVFKFLQTAIKPEEINIQAEPDGKNDDHDDV
jgi:hypothetical protein